MKITPFIASMALALPALCSASDRIQGGYSLEPLQEPVFTAEEIASEGARLNNYMIEHYAELDPRRRQTFLEGLYALVSAYAANEYVEHERVLPTKDDLLLRSLFSWAEPLGAYGGHLLYNEMLARADLPDIPPMPALRSVPDAFSLTLEGDVLRLASARGGWSVDVPYYFMIFELSEFDTKHGPRTQLAVLSTSAAAHEGRPGLSQGNLRLFAGPGQTGRDFERYWQRVLAFEQDVERAPLGVGPLRSLRRFDTEAQIHTEMVSWQGMNGPLVVYYAGAPGVYEKNRAHFLDFVRSLRGELN